MKASQNGSFTPIGSQGAEDILSLVGQARQSFPEDVRTPGAGGGGQDIDYIPPITDIDSKTAYNRDTVSLGWWGR